MNSQNSSYHTMYLSSIFKPQYSSFDDSLNQNNMFQIDNNIKLSDLFKSSKKKRHQKSLLTNILKPIHEPIPILSNYLDRVSNKKELPETDDQSLKNVCPKLSRQKQKAIESKLWVLIEKGGYFTYIKVLHEYYEKYLSKNWNKFLMENTVPKMEDRDYSLNKRNNAKFLSKENNIFDQEFDCQKSPTNKVKKLKQEKTLVNLDLKLVLKPENLKTNQETKVSNIKKESIVILDTFVSSNNNINKKKNFTDIFADNIIKVLNGTPPKKEWLSNWDSIQTKIFWLMLLKYNILPEKWIQQLKKSLKFPSSDYKINLINRKKSYAKEKVMMMIIIYWLLENLIIKKKEISTFFKFYEFDNSFCISKLNKKILIGFFNNVHKNYLTKNLFNFSFFSCMKINMNSKIKNLFLKTLDKMKIKNQMFNKLCRLFINKNGMICEKRNKMMVKIIKKTYLNQYQNLKSTDCKTIKISEKHKRSINNCKSLDNKQYLKDSLNKIKQKINL